MVKTCPFCGAQLYLSNGRYSNKHGLCKDCMKRFNNGEIELCPDCGVWHEEDEPCGCFPEWLGDDSDDDTICVVCGNISEYGYDQCVSCYYETQDFMEELDEGNIRTVRDLRDHYYNLRERIANIKNPRDAQRQCNRLFAIAKLAEDNFDDSSLNDKVCANVAELLKRKQPKREYFVYDDEEDEESHGKNKPNVSQDGHTLDSDMEVRIDDVLYNACILHCYGKSIDEIREKNKKCDWFIPILNGKGIYIEYWGMKTAKYLKDRAEKEALYKKYNIPYISIEADDPKKDTSTFRSNLIRDLTKLAVERFGFMPEWKR